MGSLPNSGSRILLCSNLNTSIEKGLTPVMTSLRLKRLFSLLAALFVLAIPVSAASPASASSLSATAAIASAPARATTVTITKYPGSVRRNSYASITVKTTPNASCTLTVYYKSGPSKAAGVGTKRASAKGIASWTWKVGGNTTKGTWPVVVTCGGASARTTLTVP
jgi:hypothetical protein